MDTITKVIAVAGIAAQLAASRPQISTRKIVQLAIEILDESTRQVAAIAKAQHEALFAEAEEGYAG